jgi:hypothetical protein
MEVLFFLLLLWFDPFFCELSMTLFCSVNVSVAQFVSAFYPIPSHSPQFSFRFTRRGSCQPACIVSLISHRVSRINRWYPEFLFDCRVCREIVFSIWFCFCSVCRA